MTPKRFWRFLPLLFLAVAGLRFWLGGNPTPPPTGETVGVYATNWAEHLPGPPEPQNQQGWLSSVLASPAWNWPPSDAQPGGSAQPSLDPTTAPNSTWVLIGVYSDGFTKRALVRYDDGALLELEAGDTLPSGEEIKLILEDDLVLAPASEPEQPVRIRVGRASKAD